MARLECIQIGFTALREPKTGEFLPAVPLYIEATRGAAAEEAGLIEDISRVLAERMRQYVDDCKQQGLME